VQLEVKLHWTQINKISEIVDYEEPRVIRRANILSCLQNGMATNLISEVLHVDPKTVRNVASVFLESGLDRALYDDERCGRPIDIDDRERSRIIAMVCSDPPKGHYRWTLDLVVEEALDKGFIKKGNISREQVRIILQEHDLKPWLEKMWCIGELDEEYLEQMEDVLDVYERPYDPLKPVVCLDEKPVALIDDTRERVASKPGAPAKVDYEYERDGSVNVFCAIEPKQGVYFNKPTERRASSDFAEFMQNIEEHYKDAEKIVLVMDNLSTHTKKALIESLGEVQGERIWSRFEVHYTPKHASWLNQAEIAIGMYSRQCLGDGRVGNMARLKAKTAAWNAWANKKAQTIHWRFTKTKARKSFKYSVQESTSGKTYLMEY